MALGILAKVILSIIDESIQLAHTIVGSYIQVSFTGYYLGLLMMVNLLNGINIIELGKEIGVCLFDGVFVGNLASSKLVLYLCLQIL